MGLVDGEVGGNGPVLRHETRILWGFVVVVGLDVDFENFDWDSVLGKVVECLSRSQ